MAKQQRPVANIGFPGAFTAVVLFWAAVGMWPFLVWHRTAPDGSIHWDAATWVACGVWWAALAPLAVGAVLAKVRPRQRRAATVPPPPPPARGPVPMAGPQRYGPPPRGAGRAVRGYPPPPRKP